MSSRPTHVQELTPWTRASYQGFCDASPWGVVWFPISLPLSPIVWYWKWPLDIRNNLVTAYNPKGTITISDLELLVIFMHFLTLEQAVPTLHHQIQAIWCDNIPVVAWVYKFRTSTYHLASHILMAIAKQLHKNHAGLLSVDHISGIYNILADCTLESTQLTQLISCNFSHTNTHPHRDTSGYCSNSTTNFYQRSLLNYERRHRQGQRGST